MLDPVTVKHLRTTVKLATASEWAMIASELSYQDFCKVLPSDTLQENYMHLLESQVIEDYGEEGGGVRFEEQVIGETIFTNHTHKWGWEESENKFTDLKDGIVGGEGINLLAAATEQSTQAAAYYPQKLGIEVLRNGTASSYTTDNGNVVKLVCFDGHPLFYESHPYNFKRTALGTFNNYWHGAASSSTPGFLPLAGPFSKHATLGWVLSGTNGTTATNTVSLEDGVNNLWTAITYIKGIKMADGKTPRRLKPTKIIGGPRIQQAVTTMLSAQFIAAMASNSTGGATDIKGAITALGQSAPTFLDELMGLGTYEEYDWYLLCEKNAGRSTLGPINVGMREPWRINLYAAMSGSGTPQLELAIANKLKAIGQMRMFRGVGMPQFLFKSEAPRS